MPWQPAHSGHNVSVRLRGFHKGIRGKSKVAGDCQNEKQKYSLCFDACYSGVTCGNGDCFS